MNRFLFSACLPVMIFSLTVNVTPAHAGFDWTPPEDTKEVMMPDVSVTPVDEQNLPPVEDRSQQDEKMPVFEQPIIKDQQAGEVKMKTKVFSSQKPLSKAPEALAPNEGKKLESQEEKPAFEEGVKTLEKKSEKLPPADSSIIPLPVETKGVIPVEKVNVDNQNSTDKSAAPVAPAEKKIEPINAIQKAKTPQQEATQAPQEAYKGGSEVDSYAGAKKEKRNQKSVPESQDKVGVPPAEQNVSKPKKNELLINPFPLDDKKTQSSRTGKEVVPAHAAVKGNEKKAAIVEELAPASSYPVVEGFGSDMPLVMALGQIVPAQYAYSFGKGVNPGVIVSWEGGKPWDQVLQGVLQPLGVHMNIDGNKLSLSVTAMEEPVVIQRPKENAPASISYPDPDNTGKKLQGKKAKEQPLKNPAETSKDKIIPLPTEVQPVEQKKSPVEVKEEKDLKEDEKSSKEDEKKAEKTIETKTEKSDLTELSSEKQKKNSKQHPQLADVLEISPENEGQPKQELAPTFPEFEMTEGKLVSPATETSKKAKPVKEVKEKIKVDQTDTTVPAEKLTKEEKSPIESLVPVLPQETNVSAAEPVIEEKKKAPVDLKKIKVWEAKKGKDLETLLKEWCDQIGVELVWSAKEKHKLAHNVVVSGTLESALKVTFAQAVKNAPQYEVVKGDVPQIIVK